MHYFLIAALAFGLILLGSLIIYSFFSRTTSMATGLSDGTGLFRFSRNGKMGFRDMNDHVIIAPKFDEVNPFSEGLAVVMVGKKYAYINPRGQRVLGWYEGFCGDFSYGLAVGEEGGKFGYRDSGGSFVIPPKFLEGREFSDGFAVVKSREKYGLIDTEGNQVVPEEMDEMLNVQEGAAPARKQDLWGMIKPDGSWLLPPRYILVENFEGGRAKVREKSGENLREGILDTAGQIEWTDALDALNKFNRDARKLEQVSGDLMDYFTSKGCPCRYPRFRKVVGFQGAAVMCFETEALVGRKSEFLVRDKEKTVDTGDSITQGYFKCRSCGSAWRQGREAFSGNIISNYLILEDYLGDEMIGAPVERPFPLFLGFKGPSSMLEFEDGFVKVSLYDYEKFMRKTADQSA